MLGELNGWWIRCCKDIRKWMSEVDRNANENVAKMIIGNKMDLNDKREVSYDEANAFCEENGLDYIETSAKESTNIEAAFCRMTQIIYQKDDATGKPKAKVDTKKVAANNGKSGYCIIL